MDVKLNINFIIAIEKLSSVQLYSVCEYFELLDPNICSITDLEKDKSLRKQYGKQVIKLLEEKESTSQLQEESASKQAKIPKTRFCFDINNKFICLSTKVSPGSHNIVLPQVIKDQDTCFNSNIVGANSDNNIKSFKSDVMFIDCVSLLMQACVMTSIEDDDQPILIPWCFLSSTQLLIAAKLFGVTVNSLDISQHKGSLASYLKPLCASSEVFCSKGYSVNDFENILFAFQLSNIFHCNFAVIPENSNYTAVVSASTLPVDFGDKCLFFLDGTKRDTNFSRSLRSSGNHKGAKRKKVVSVGSTETFTTLQLNSVISHFCLDIPMAGRKNLKERVLMFLSSKVYQQQLISSPLERILYCFDGNSNYVCMFYELSAAEHEIVITNKQKEQYDLKVIIPDYDDLRKILLQSYLTQTEFVIELPWIALTRSQMLAISRDKSPGLNVKKVLASRNIPGLLSGILKQSSAYKDQFKDASKFDSCLTFGITIEEPLFSCDWGLNDSAEGYKEVSKYRKLFGKKIVAKESKVATSARTPQEATNPEAENPEESKPDMTTDEANIDRPVTPVVNSHSNNKSTETSNLIAPSCHDKIAENVMSKPDHVDNQYTKECSNNISSNVSASESSINSSSESDESSYKDSVSEVEESMEDITSETLCSENEFCKSIVITNMSNNSTESKYQSCITTPTSDLEDPMSLFQVGSNESNQEIARSLQKDKHEVSDPQSDTIFHSKSQMIMTEDSEISLSTPLIIKSNLADASVNAGHTPSIPSHLSSTPKREDLNAELQHNVKASDISSNTSQVIAATCHRKLDLSICDKCSDEVQSEDILECYICCLKTHFSCYDQKKNGKPVANSYYNVASKHLPNHKWFCNDCIDLPKETILQQRFSKSDNIADKPFLDPNLLQCKPDSSNKTKSMLTSVDMERNNGDLNMAHGNSCTLPEHPGTLEKIWSAIEAIQESQGKLGSKMTKLEHHAEHWASSNSLSKVDKKVIKALQSNTEILNDTLGSLSKVQGINEEICCTKSILIDVKDQVTTALRLVTELTKSNCDTKEQKNSPDTYKQVKESHLFSSIAQHHDHSSSQHLISKNQVVKPTVEPRKTIVISKDLDKSLAKGSSRIRSAFNQHFKNVRIENCFVSKGGSVFIELSSEEDALSVQKAWKKEFFSESTVNNASTTCTLFAALQNSVLLKGISLDIPDNELLSAVESQFPGAQARRFVKRDGTKLTTFKVDFHQLAHKQVALNNGIDFDHRKMAVEDFIPRQRVIQCYNCFKFGHVAKLCNQLHPTCQVCAGNHSQDDCHQQSFKCRNCQSSNHFATSKDCPAFMEAITSIKRYNSHNGRTSTTSHHDL